MNEHARKWSELLQAIKNGETVQEKVVIVGTQQAEFYWEDVHVIELDVVVSPYLYRIKPKEPACVWVNSAYNFMTTYPSAEWALTAYQGGLSAGIEYEYAAKKFVAVED